MRTLHSQIDNEPKLAILTSEQKTQELQDLVSRYPNLHDVCRLMITQGVRPEEATSFAKKDVDFENGRNEPLDECIGDWSPLRDLSMPSVLLNFILAWFRQADTSSQSPESRIVAKDIKAGICVEVLHSKIGPSIVCAAKPFECFVLVP